MRHTETVVLDLRAGSKGARMEGGVDLGGEGGNRPSPRRVTASLLAASLERPATADERMAGVEHRRSRTGWRSRKSAPG